MQIFSKLLSGYRQGPDLVSRLLHPVTVHWATCACCNSRCWDIDGDICLHLGGCGSVGTRGALGLNLSTRMNWVQWYIFVMLALGRQRQGDWKLKVTLNYIGSLKPALLQETLFQQAGRHWSNLWASLTDDLRGQKQQQQ